MTNGMRPFRVLTVLYLLAVAGLLAGPVAAGPPVNVRPSESAPIGDAQFTIVSSEWLGRHAAADVRVLDVRGDVHPYLDA